MSARVLGISCVAVLCLVCSKAFGQSFGVEANNALMPASGAMGGTSIARPQDLTSAINANPATLTQFHGTQFTFSGAWSEPTITMTQTSSIPLLGVDPYSGKSTAQGVAAGNIGVTQDLHTLGLPATFGIGFLTAAAGGADYRHIPQSMDTNAALSVFEMTAAFGIDVTDQASVGAGMSMGIGIFDGPFVGIGGMTVDYALRGVIGAEYDLAPCTNAGLYYQSKQSFTFAEAIDFAGLGTSQDIEMDLPENIGIGIADNSLMDGQLLLAFDVLYKLWDEADLYATLYDNQWVFQFGAQYTSGRYRLRLGYTYAENPMDPAPVSIIGGVIPPGGPPSVRYTQGLLAVTSPHRISAGVGVSEVLPNLDFDLMAGGMFRDSEQLGPFTTTSIQAYWIGAGLTWHFGGCCRPAGCE